MASHMCLTLFIVFSSICNFFYSRHITEVSSMTPFYHIFCKSFSNHPIVANINSCSPVYLRGVCIRLCLGLMSYFVYFVGMIFAPQPTCAPNNAKSVFVLCF